MIMMLASDQAGAQHSQSPVVAESKSGDGTSLKLQVPAPLVKIAQRDLTETFSLFRKGLMSQLGQTEKWRCGS
jgi:hypothetical protein